MSDEDVRWKQRFESFDMAYRRLKEAVDMPELNELERNGLVQRYDFTLEMGLKTLKDYLQHKKFEFKPSPKDTLRLAQQSEYINYAQELIDGLELRNELSHDYSGEKFLKSEQKFREVIFPALTKLHHFLEYEINKKR